MMREEYTAEMNKLMKKMKGIANLHYMGKYEKKPKKI